MRTRQFGREFSAFVVIVELYDGPKSQDLEIFLCIFVFFKRALIVKFLKHCSESLHGDTMQMSH